MEITTSCHSDVEPEFCFGSAAVLATGPKIRSNLYQSGRTLKLAVEKGATKFHINSAQLPENVLGVSQGSLNTKSWAHQGVEVSPFVGKGIHNPEITH